MNSTNDQIRTALATVAEHLTTFDLPAQIASLDVVARLDGLRVDVQLDDRQLPTLAAAVLAWADTLIDVTASEWRTLRGDSVHLHVEGRLPGGLPVLVYGALDHSARLFGPYLKPGDRETVPLGLVRDWATLADPGRAA